MKKTSFTALLFLALCLLLLCSCDSFGRYGSFKTNYGAEDLEEIILIRIAHETEHSLDSGEHVDFLTRLNKIRYRSHNGMVKTDGAHFIILKYSDETVKISQYRTSFYVEGSEEKSIISPRWYGDDFVALIESYLES
ncbi:MAG TPA: hypothetical protein PLB58_04735 [Bacilli bacterium]|nr:hypothetical protein [Bacilli bacterium]